MSDISPTMKFKNRKVYGTNVLSAASPQAEALLALMSPRKYLEPKDLFYVSNMGIKWEIVGDIREFKGEMDRINPR